MTTMAMSMTDIVMVTIFMKGIISTMGMTTIMNITIMIITTMRRV